MPCEKVVVGEKGEAYSFLPACGEKVAGRPDEGPGRLGGIVPEERRGGCGVAHSGEDMT